MSLETELPKGENEMVSASRDGDSGTTNIDPKVSHRNIDQGVANIDHKVSHRNIDQKKFHCKLNSETVDEADGSEQPLQQAESAPSNIAGRAKGMAFEHFAHSETCQDHKTAFENLLRIEIFSGSGRLTASIRKLGLRAVAIDRGASRTSGPVTILDLTKTDDLDFLKNFIISERHNIIYIHMAPPCGTCSAARNKRHRDLEEAGYILPQPVRSRAFPMGLPTNRGLDAAKVAAANILYYATLEIAKLCLQYDILFSLENPENSLFWETDPIQELFRLCNGYHNVFQSCMMGGDRDKRTKWWASKPNFNGFNIMCNNDHDHKPWKPIQTESGLHFPTSEEASYPFLLCERVAHVVKETALELGFVPVESLPQQAKLQTSAALQHVNMGFLARGQKLKPLVSEFAQYRSWLFDAGNNENEVNRILHTFPKGARIVHRKLVKWGEVRVDDVDGKSFVNSNNGQQSCDIVEKISFGIPREPDDFVQQAIKAGHPRFLDFKSIKAIDDLLSFNLRNDSSKILERRAAWLRKWTNRAKELMEDERALHSSLPHHCAAVLAGKRLLLFGEMLTDISYPDVNLIKDICAGFKITGWMRDSGCFEKLPKQPSMTVAGLTATSRGLNHTVIAKAAASTDDELVQAAWDETQLELERKWIWLDDSGDFSGLSLTHRFGLQQKKKVRVIDNFKTSGVNSTCGMSEKQKLFGLDFLATTLVRALVLFEAGSITGVEGKTFDLSSAYKQFPLHSSDREFIRIAVPRPGGKDCAVYGLNALPFGASGSVAGFLRVSTAVFHILTVGLGVWSGTFFDDFPILCHEGVSRQTEQHVSMLLDLLGLRFARDGKKWSPFSKRLEVLGVIVDLEKFNEGVVYFCHTESRKAELDDTISKHLATNRMTQKEAEVLRGRLIWFESFMFGRIANLSLHAIGQRAISSDGSSKLDEALKRALKFFQTRILHGPPIEIRAAVGEVIHIFTDGAFEPESVHLGTVGGVIYSERGERLGFFSEIVPTSLMECYLSVSQNPIFLVELLAALVAISLWGRLYSHRYVVNYVDNEASRSALVKAWSSVKYANNIIGRYVEMEMQYFWKPWFSRVASFSNPSDAPSRLEIRELLESGVQRFHFDWTSEVQHLSRDAHL